jgi:hypothetical protein
MELLNKDLILKISSLLTLREGLNFSLCNKRLFECIFGNKYFWINHLNKRFPLYFSGYNVRRNNEINYKYTYHNLLNEIRGNKKIIEKINPKSMVFGPREENFNIGLSFSFHFNENDAFYSIFRFLHFKILWIGDFFPQAIIEKKYDLLNEKKIYCPEIENFDCEKKLNATEIKWLKILMNKVKHFVFTDIEKNPYSDFLEILIEYFLHDIIPFTIRYGELLNVPIYQKNF